MNTIDALKQQLKELEAEIAETRKRLPAHSVKPPIMMCLLDLEDRYEALLEQISAAASSAHDLSRRRES
ncbi:MAG: hypothetical protein ACOZF0_10720 [Thermodesulfobacteriota bacterium]